MTTLTTNGRPERKQLSEQLDRLDAILDGLSGALNEAVADAARAGVKEAVTAAVVELLTDGDLRAALHRASAPEGEAKPERPTLRQRIRAAISQAAGAARSAVTAVTSFVTNRARVAEAAARRVLLRLREVRPVRVALTLALAAPTVVAAAKCGSLRRLGGWARATRAVGAAALDRVARWGGSTLGRLGTI
jgi:hypothetical protein